MKLSRVLTFTTLYPNDQQPTHGVFVENRMSHFSGQTGVEVSVCAPVPWFPLKNGIFGLYAKYARVSRHERRGELEVVHPRYPVLPKVGMSIAPLLMAAMLLPTLKRLFRENDMDLVDAHYLYPDGVAAVLLGKLFDVPVVLSARGSDVHLLPKYYFPRKMILWALKRCDAVISVSTELKRSLVSLGVEENKITVLRNGVDFNTFSPSQDRDGLRRALGARKTTLLMVGRLVELKGHKLVIDAIRNIPEVELWIVGDGPELSLLKSQVAQVGLGDRVRFVGGVEHSQLAQYYAAADALILASSREGWPNVLLEAMACGTPVIATAVGGVPEVVGSGDVGILVKERSEEEITAAIRQFLATSYKTEVIRSYAERFGWAETSKGLYQLFNKVLEERAR